MKAGSDLFCIRSLARQEPAGARLAGLLNLSIPPAADAEMLLPGSGIRLTPGAGPPSGVPLTAEGGVAPALRPEQAVARSAAFDWRRPV